MNSETKNKILDLAADLLQEKGFNAFSYHDISSSLGIRNAAVHYHYPSKESLGLDVIRRARTRLGVIIQKSETLAGSPWQQLDLFLEIYRNNLANNQKVCMLGSIGTDYFTLPESMRDEARSLLNENLDWLEGLLESGRQSGQFTFRGDARSKALTLATTLAGGLQIARVMGDEHFKAIEKQIITELTT